MATHRVELVSTAMRRSFAFDPESAKKQQSLKSTQHACTDHLHARMLDGHADSLCSSLIHTPARNAAGRLLSTVGNACSALMGGALPTKPLTNSLLAPRWFERKSSACTRRQ